MSERFLQSFNIAINMTKRDLKIKYKNSVLGVIWSLINPLIMVLVYTFAFKVVLKNDVENFPLFVVVGLAPWNLFSSIVLSSSNIIVNNGTLIGKVYFPREILIVSNVLFHLFFYIMTMVIVSFVVVFMGGSISFMSILQVIFMSCVLIIFAMGISYFTSALSVKYRDVPHLIEVLFMALFWLTPILYEPDSIPSSFSFLIDYNPASYYILMIRNGLMNTTTIDGGVSKIVATFVIYGFGYIYFKSNEKKFSELI